MGTEPIRYTAPAAKRNSTAKVFQADESERHRQRAGHRSAHGFQADHAGRADLEKKGTRRRIAGDISALELEHSDCGEHHAFS